jgi:hypothetical protein
LDSQNVKTNSGLCPLFFVLVGGFLYFFLLGRVYLLLHLSYLCLLVKQGWGYPELPNRVFGILFLFIEKKVFVSQPQEYSR